MGNALIDMIGWMLTTAFFAGAFACAVMLAVLALDHFTDKRDDDGSQ